MSRLRPETGLVIEASRFEARLAKAHERKRQLIWVGYLEALPASGRLPSEAGPAQALQEMRRFRMTFGDPRAFELASDLMPVAKAQRLDPLAAARGRITTLMNAAPLNERDRMHRFLGHCGALMGEAGPTRAAAEALWARLSATPELADFEPMAPLRQALHHMTGLGLFGDADGRPVQDAFLRLLGEGLGGKVSRAPGILRAATILRADPDPTPAIQTSSVSSAPAVDPLIPLEDPASLRLEGARVVLVGAFFLGPQAEVARRIQAAGGLIEAEPTPETTYVVLGASGVSPEETAARWGATLNAAHRLAREGAPLRFVAASALEARLRSLSDAR